MNRMTIFTGNANAKLSREICGSLGVPLGKCEVTTFSDGETRVKIGQNVRGKDVFVVQSTCYPANQNLMELLIMVDALRRSSAQRITAVLPYYGYARQDRKDQPRVPITAKLVANLITTAGAERVLTMDLHAAQIQGFFDIKVDHLFAAPIIIDYFQKKKLQDLVVLSPDVGGVRRARAYARRLNASLAIVDKRRPVANEAKVVRVVGEVKEKEVLIVDDMIDTGGTLMAAIEVLQKEGAQAIYATCTHPVLSGNVYEKIDKSPLKEVVVTDTIPLNKGRIKSKIKVLSVSSRISL